MQNLSLQMFDLPKRHTSPLLAHEANAPQWGKQYFHTIRRPFNQRIIHTHTSRHITSHFQNGLCKRKIRISKQVLIDKSKKETGGFIQVKPMTNLLDNLSYIR